MSAPGAQRVSNPLGAQAAGLCSATAGKVHFGETPKVRVRLALHARRGRYQEMEGRDFLWGIAELRPPLSKISLINGQDARWLHRQDARATKFLCAA
ncbi:MAG: hypothetical protein DMF19_08000 [Verrucomicrobia bacterium]|nr:MAG: hypothetical protein DMF19_08000 [Verrucomicrobiota bacterium]